MRINGFKTCEIIWEHFQFHRWFDSNKWWRVILKKGYTKINPPELELKKENKSNTETTFLDLDIKLNLCK